jgi:hypothetical protein
VAPGERKAIDWPAIRDVRFTSTAGMRPCTWQLGIKIIFLRGPWRWRPLSHLP